VNLDERRQEKWSVREWGAMAASVAAGLLIGVGVMNMQSPVIVAADGGMQARGSLVQALDTQLASDQAGAVRIGLSFRTQDNGYCRTFDLTRTNTSGLACRGGDAWSVVATAAGGGGEVRMVGVAPAIIAAVEANIVGDPLDAQAEQRARADGWR
jgi:hypothetical protein